MGDFPLPYVSLNGLTYNIQILLAMFSSAHSQIAFLISHCLALAYNVKSLLVLPHIVKRLRPFKEVILTILKNDFLRFM